MPETSLEAAVLERKNVYEDKIGRYHAEMFSRTVYEDKIESEAGEIVLKKCL
ncbi:hypothetical protein SAMN05421736_101932 [Evansella caseinilytica]|uniref:Uncharacterized protein n=1 Tax=Evansella caseinilytica TaxID=1503961 RepID=A0A1H3IVM2_9BACI|nr:hypothetical protein SAMN05421736_101932 [Evansella caseinilytica]